MTKIQESESILNTSKEKQQITYKGTPIEPSADFSAETADGRRTDLNIQNQNEKGEVTTNATEIQRAIRDYDEQPYANEMNNLENWTNS